MRAAIKALLLGILLVAPAVSSAAEKPFQRADLSEGARRLEASVKRDAAARPKTVAELRREIEASIARNPRLATRRMGELLARAPDEAATWLRLARTSLVIDPDDDKERNELRDRAAAAAYLAYQRALSRNDEGDALAIIGRVYADRQLWRAALDTLKLSLERREVAAVRTTYEDLRDEHGFRMLDFSVDADVLSPRACLQFSEPLAKRADFAPFFSIAGIEKPIVTGAERQLCVEGLKHGERYELTLRAGVPSATGETLRRPAELVIYVRDRKPNVRFTGRAYVLPRTGQRGIPLIAVNSKRIAIEVYRIGDRSLVPSALDGQFRRSLEGYELERLRENLGQRVYQGELEVESELNKEVTVAFPVDEALGRLTPGVYVVSARAGEIAADSAERTTQWFVVSDLGLTAVSAEDGLHVFLRGLGDAKPVADVEVRLVAKNNEVLATRRTDADGAVRFEAGLVKGAGGLAPAAVIAQRGSEDYVFLSLADSAFDLTDRGVAGRIAPGALDAFLVTERGVYRTGETVRLTALLRDAQARAVGNIPLTFILSRPDGVEDRRQTVIADQLGGRSLDLPLLDGAMTGTWRVRAYTDPKGPALGEIAFLVEDYVPDRIEFDLKSAAPALARSRPAEVTLDGRYLFGPPAAGLELDGEIQVRAVPSRPGFDQYRFGLADDDFTAVRRPLADLPRTDAQGHAALRLELPEVPASTQPLAADVIVRMAEPGGRAVERKLVLPVAVEAPMIGVRPLFGDRVDEGGTAGFEVVLVGADDKLAARSGLKWELFRVETRYQWYRVSGSWGYEPVRTTRKMADGTIDALATGPVRISAPVNWGRYRLEVTAPNGPVTSVVFYGGWAGEASVDTPDRLDVTLDKAEYAPGDTLTVNLAPRTAGSATVLVIGDKVLARAYLTAATGPMRATFRVEENWGPGAYVVAFHHRPLDVQQSRMPGRSLGVAWLGVSRTARTLDVKLEMPAEIRPHTTLSVLVAISGLAPGETARVVVAAVDVGILNLTNYKPPAPADYFLGQRRLSGEVRDLYGMLIDGMQATRGRLRTGGDAPGLEMTGSPPSQVPLALYSGIVTVDAQGRARVDFEIPAFDGTARVMAMAWSGDKLGQASTDVLIRDPVVVTATLPRFLAAGDRATLRFDVTNVTGPAAEYTVDVTTGGAVEVPSETRRVTLAAKGRASLALPLTGKDIGPGNVTVRVAGPGGLAIERSYALATRPALPPVERRSVRTLASGESIVVGPEMFTDTVPGTATLSLSVMPEGALDVPSLLLALDRYPYGCTEQITSRALSLVYLNELASESRLALDLGADARIRQAIARVIARQSADGGFGLWAAGDSDTWLNAYVTDFLTRASERGFEVPKLALRLALDKLRNALNISGDLSQGGAGAAYALYVLARNGVAPVGDLRYLADAKLDALGSPLAKGQVAAALALLGDRVRAERVFLAAAEALPVNASAPEPGRGDYGSELRDAAALATLAAEAGIERVARLALQRVEAYRNVTPRTSTQENVWLVLAARTLAQRAAGLALEIDGQPHRGAFFASYKPAELAGKTVRVVNRGDTPVQIVIAVRASPASPEPAASRGFRIARSYHTLDGKPADPTRVTQNQRLVVVLKVTEEEKAAARVVMADHLPAGFEIDNPRLLVGADTGALAWLGKTTETAYSEFRDDRFVAAFNREGGGDELMTVAYVVRAVSPGRYVHPPAVVEDMYRPDRFARTAAGTVEVVGR